MKKTAKGEIFVTVAVAVIWIGVYLFCGGCYGVPGDADPFDSDPRDIVTGEPIPVKD